MFKGKNFVGTAREQFFFHNTLLCFVKGLEGRNITVDLRGDSVVCGQVAIVDGYMNITFAPAIFVDAKGNEFKYPNLFVHARSIRYIHIPENINPMDLIKEELNKSKPHKPKRSTEKSRKAKKALRQHMETVASLEVSGSTSSSAVLP